MNLKVVSVIVGSAFLFGCAAQTFNINEGSAAAPTEQKSQHFFISGLGQQQAIDAAKVCGGADKIIKVEAQHTFVNGVLGFVTFGIYTPRDAKVYCKVS